MQLPNHLLFFANLICSSVPGPKAMTKHVCVLLYPIKYCSKKLQSKHFETRITKMQSDHTKNCSWRKKSKETIFVFLFINEQIPFKLFSLNCLLQTSKNRTEKNILLHKQTPPTNTFNWVVR